MTQRNEYDSSKLEINMENAEEHLAVLTLGGLTPEEEAEVELLIAADPELALEMQAFSEVVDELPYMAEPMEVSKKVEDMLFKRVEANAQARFKISPSTTQIFKARIPQKIEPVKQLTWYEGLLSRPLIGASLAAFALVLAGLFGLLSARLNAVSNTNEQLQNEVERSILAEQILTDQVADLNQDLDEANGFVEAYKTQLTNALIENQDLLQTATAAELTRDEIATQVAALVEENSTLSNRNGSLEERVAYQTQIIDLFSSSDAQAIEIGGTDINPNAVATLVFNPETNLAIMVVNDLPQLNEDEVYQVLLIRGEEHDTSETFTVNAGGENIFIVESPSPMAIFDTVGVSIEPDGGSPQRTGEVVLLGEIVG